LLANFVLDVARRGIEPAIVARLGTWWHDLSSDTLSMSDEMLDLLGLDPAGSRWRGRRSLRWCIVTMRQRRFRAWAMPVGGCFR
jgi:hypothetical protein